MAAARLCFVLTMMMMMMMMMVMMMMMLLLLASAASALAMPSILRAPRLLRRGTMMADTRTGFLFAGTRGACLSADEPRWSPLEATLRVGGPPPPPLSRLGFSFSVSGLVFPYHIGVAEVLRSEALLDDSTPVQGASGGALAATAVAANVAPGDAMRASVACADLCREHGAAARLGVALREVLEGPGSIIDDEVHLRLSRRAAACDVSYTTLGWRGLTPRSATSFGSRQDLINCLCASCHLPLYSDSWRPFLRVRGNLALDGFYSAPTAALGTRPIAAAEQTVRASPFGSVRPEVLAFDIVPPAHLSPDPRLMLHWALGTVPPDQTDQTALFNLGQQAARAWIQRTDPKTTNDDDDDDDDDDDSSGRLVVLGS